jgi:hypothetical protein
MQNMMFGMMMNPTTASMLSEFAQQQAKRQKIGNVGPGQRTGPPDGHANYRDLREARDMTALLTMYKQEPGDNMTVERISDFFHYLKILSRDQSMQGKKAGKELLTELGKRVQPRISELSAKQIISILAAHAGQTQRLLSEILHPVRDRIVQSILTFNGRDVANCLWNLAKIKQGVSKNVMDEMHQRLFMTLGDCELIIYIYIYIYIYMYIHTYIYGVISVHTHMHAYAHITFIRNRIPNTHIHNRHIHTQLVTQKRTPYTHV